MKLKNSWLLQKRKSFNNAAAPSATAANLVGSVRNFGLNNYQTCKKLFTINLSKNHAGGFSLDPETVACIERMTKSFNGDREKAIKHMDSIVHEALKYAHENKENDSEDDEMEDWKMSGNEIVDTVSNVVEKVAAVNLEETGWKDYCWSICSWKRSWCKSGYWKTNPVQHPGTAVGRNNQSAIWWWGRRKWINKKVSLFLYSGGTPKPERPQKERVRLSISQYPLHLQ